MGSDLVRRVAVLGTGNVGVAMAADLAERGTSTILWGRTLERFATLYDRQRIRLHRGGEVTTVAVRVETDVATSVRDADLIVIAVPAHVQRSVFAACAPHVSTGIPVVLVAGNLGSHELLSLQPGAEVAEVAVPPFAARRDEDDGAAIILPARRVPAAGAGAAVEALQSLYPAVERVGDVVDVFLHVPTYVIHGPLTVANAGAVEALYPDPGFDVQGQGTTAATRRIVDQLDDERIAVREAFGYPAPHHPQATSYYQDLEEGLFGHAALEVRDVIARYKRPMSLDHRYVHEDLAINLPTLVWLARQAGLDIPIARSLVTVASALTGRDLQGELLGSSRLPASLSSLRRAYEES